MSGKFKYPHVAWNRDTGDSRYLGVYHTLKEAKTANAVEANEEITSKVPANGDPAGFIAEEPFDYAEHDFDLIVKAWQPDEPNRAQTSLTMRCLRIDRDKVYEIVSEINGIPDTDIQVSRWAMLYNLLDKRFPKMSKPIEGWV